MKEGLKALALVSQIAISMLVPIFICLFVGKILDKIFNTAPILTFVFIALGIGAGFKSVYIITKPFYGGKDTYIDVNDYIKEDDDEEK